MLNHKLGVHRSEMDTGGDESPRELGGATDEGLKVACDRTADMVSDGEFREATELCRKVVEVGERTSKSESGARSRTGSGED